MMNKKGFTLMELLVAVFISSMVTIALVSVWKAASLQTSEGQRQAIMRNNMSIFLRMLNKDITEADTILFPSRDIPAESRGEALLVGVRNASRDRDNVYPLSQEIGNTFVFVYCYEPGRKIIRRKEVRLEDKEGREISELIDDHSACNVLQGGLAVLDNVPEFPKIETGDNAIFNVNVRIYRDFGDRATPVNIESESHFVLAGGA